MTQQKMTMETVSQQLARELDPMAIESDHIMEIDLVNANETDSAFEKDLADGTDHPKADNRPNWSNPLDFLMSCIAMSVGLGNIWRFPYIAYENGGGAFLVPYLVVLFVIGKPMYLLEMSIGQFTGRSVVQAWSMVPAARGLGWGMLFATTATLSYYVPLMAITVYYFVASFSSDLPWAVCKDDWGPCFDAMPGATNRTRGNLTGLKSSTELYFIQEVLKEKDNIDDGIGFPDWRLSLCLLASWFTVFLVIIRGVKSTGKAAYFLALFPYVVLVTLLVRGCTLPGAVDGILFFITPNWGKLLDHKVWYEAVTQAFFSLSVSFGCIIMYSSYNNFSHNVHRDTLIVTTLDTLTSLLAGFTIFAILGNLAHEMGVDDISKVVKGTTGLAFISYPEAISKFVVVPQLFAIIFFLMLYTLGIGSAVSLANVIISIVCDRFKAFKYWAVALALCAVGFLLGLVYVTPGGQWILSLVDFYLVTFVLFSMAVVEMVTISWVYGVGRFCRDVNFMLRFELSAYWRLCWCAVTPVALIVILGYTFVEMEPLLYDKKRYPQAAYTIVWILASIALLQIPIWMVVEWISRRNLPVAEMIISSFRPNARWGPKNARIKREWQEC